VFRSRRADRIKVLVWDRTGLVLVHKRLEGGKFVWPQVRDGANRCGLLVDTCLTPADGHVERVAALAMIEAYGDRPRSITLGADKGYDVEDFRQRTAVDEGNTACGPE